jgi:hypothetical protein
VDNNEVENMLTQVRTAHRLVAAYYQRIMPQLERVFSELDLEFYYWGNTEFDLCPQGHRYPFKRWGWDFLPGLNCHFLFYSPRSADVRRGVTRKGDFFVAIYLYTDDSLHSDSGHKAEPDALNLEGEVANPECSYLQVAVCKATTEDELNWWDDVWNPMQWPEFSTTPKPQSVGDDIACLATAFTYSLADFIQPEGPDKLITMIKKHQKALTNELA